MKLLSILLLLLAITPAFSQDDKAALQYYEIGIKKKKDLSLIKKGLSPFGEAFPYFFKAAMLASKGSDLQINAIYQSAYLYNFAKEEDKPIVNRKIIEGLHDLRKIKRKDSLAGEYFFRAGLAYARDYKPDSAIYTFGEARKIFESLDGDYSVLISNCYHVIGDVYKDTFNDFNSAESFYEKVLDVYERAGSSELNLFLTSKVYLELASVNKYQHDYEKALAYSLKHIAYVESLPKNFKTGHTILEMAYTNAADIYSEMGFIAEAVKLYQKAISLNSKFKEANGDLGNYYFGLGNVYRKAGQVSQSIEYYKKAIKIFDLASSPKNILSVRNCQYLAECFLEQGDIKNARFYYSKGMKLLNKFDFKKSGQISDLYRSIGKYFDVVEQTDSSLIYYQRSLIEASSKFKSLHFKDNPSMSDVVLNDFAYEALLAKATTLYAIYIKTQNIDFATSALKSFDLAEKLLVESRARLDMDNAKWTYFDSNFGLYQQALSLLYEMEQKQHNDTLISKAFYFMESSKSKMLADAIKEKEFTIPLLASDSIVRLLDFERRNSYQLQDEYKKHQDKPEDQARIRDLIIETDRKIQRVENDIELKYPSYVKTKYQYSIPDITKLQKLSREHGAAIIEYFWGLDEVFGLAINKDKVIFKHLESTDSIQSVLKEFRDMLASSKHSYSAVDISSFEELSNLCYRLLVSPFELVATREERIIILPDGPIEQIPFEVLVSTIDRSSTQRKFSSLNYLLKKHVLSYSFSSSYLLNQDKTGLVKPKMLAFGFADLKGFRSGGGERLKNKIQLPGSELELKTIFKEFPQGKYYYGNEVTEERFKEEAPNSDLIHLAVHGLGDTEQNYSASLFFCDSTTSKEDGRLHWYELFGLRLKARLAVISSCESGIGKAYRGEGMLSMASAFAFAGGRNIVMGLWKVDDRVSANLMGDFYKNLQAEDPVDVALTKAKRSYLERGDDLTANPKIWASLVSYGNEQIIIKDNVNQYWIGFIVLILVACSSILIYIKRKRGHL